MKQYRITSDNIVLDSPDDCALAPDDPIHELKVISYLGGLGSREWLAKQQSAKTWQKYTNNTGK